MDFGAASFVAPNVDPHDPAEFAEAAHEASQRSAE
jgi:hypothetical protein